MPTPSPKQQAAAARLKARIAAQVKRAAGKGVKAAVVFLSSRVKETISVPAPRRRVKPAGGAPVYYVATAPATPGEPIRKLSGAARRGTGWRMEREGFAGTSIGAVGIVYCNSKSPTGFNYPRYHELKGLGRKSGLHPFILPTVLKYRAELGAILGREIHINLAGKRA